MIDGLLVCDKCQNTVKLILTLVAQFVMWYKKKITEQSFKRFIYKSPPNTVLNSVCLLSRGSALMTIHWYFWFFSFGLHGTIVLPHFLWSWASSLTDFGLWHVSGKVTVRIMRLVRNSPHFFPPAWWLPCFKLWGFHHLE